MTDTERENQIDRLMLTFQFHPDRDTRNQAYKDACELIKQRTPAQVMHMEQQKRLM
ncbi:hypothetical protein UFOVP83_39 [uncultured Caudovirales phage]|uniref:Uncharacterized protein n=1 Tax=uncultured Caudovirales phage TaxID=2100421 RepID=A0A6J5TB83_9CAUD|nr:hypothetical protein UFOVP83_39 [uncultured Caudovirales phage]